MTTTITPKQAWEQVRAILQPLSAKSFNLKVEKMANGTTVIHAAMQPAFISPEGFVTAKYDSNTVLGVVNFDVREFCINQLGLTDSNIHDYISIKKNMGYSCSEFVLRDEIKKNLPDDVRRIANSTAHVFHESFNVMVDRINLIVAHLDIFKKVESNDKRLLSLLLLMIENKRIKVRKPQSAIKQMKTYLMQRGLTQAGWLRLLKMNPIERSDYIKNLSSGSKREVEKNCWLLSWLAAKNIKLKIFYPEIIFGYYPLLLSHRADIELLVERTLAEIYSKIKQPSTNQLCNELDKYRAEYNFVRLNPNLIIPKGASLTKMSLHLIPEGDWLKWTRQRRNKKEAPKKEAPKKECSERYIDLQHFDVSQLADEAMF